jgi:hypothetical protein
MKKILMIVLPLVLLTASVDSLEDWNIDQKRASEVPARTLLTSAQKNLIDILTTPNVNSNNFRMFVQYWATTTYLDEPRYNMTARLYSQNQWNAAYRDVLSDLRECKRLIDVQTDASTVPAVKANQLAVVEIMEIYTWYFLVNTFGDVPYTEALVASNSLPKYDDAQTIYNDLLTRLDAAIASITTTSGSFPSGAASADLIYAGNTTSWKAFGNALKLRMGMLLADKDNAKAKTIVEAAATGVAGFVNARVAYQAAAPNNNPISSATNPSFTSREDFVMAGAIVNAMNTLNDPRRQFYFTTVGGNYVGGNYGFSNAYASFSHVSAKISAPTWEGLFMDVAEVEFLLAEAVERGYTVAGTADTHYNAAITASILYWGGTAADATTYLAQPAVAYATAAGTYKEKIGTQKWIALNNRGWDAWVEWRRLDYPVLNPPSGPSIPDPLTIPKRMIYPVNEQTVNGGQWATAAAKFNNDDPKVKLFWDVN